jgi:hypothetical protein
MLIWCSIRKRLSNLDIVSAVVVLLHIKSNFGFNSHERITLLSTVVYEFFSVGLDTVILLVKIGVKFSQTCLMSSQTAEEIELTIAVDQLFGLVFRKLFDIVFR